MEQLQLLTRYQELSAQVQEVENTLRNSPVRKKLLHARNYIVTVQNNLKAMEDETAKIRATLDALANRHASSAGKLDKESVHYTAADDESDIEDVADMRAEVQGVLNQFNQMEKEVLNLLKKLSSMEQEIAKMATNIPKAKDDYAKTKVIYDAELAKVTEQTEPLKAEMEKIAAQLPGNLVKTLMQIGSKFANPIVSLQGNRCGGCNMELSSATLKKMADTPIIECENCGRLIYQK